MFRNDDTLDPDVNLGISDNNTDAFNCKYCSIDSFKSSMQRFTDNGLSIMCFNIRSFSKNGEEFLGYLHNCGHPFDAIILTETWAKNETQSLCHIPGYQAVHNNRPDRTGGGVSIFIKDNVEFDVIDDLNKSSDDIEMLGIKLILDKTVNSSMNLTGIYRPPNGNTEVFMSSLSNAINGNRLTASDSILTGDFNLCLLNEYSAVTRNFMNVMSSLFFRPIVTRPTRFTERTATCIDHIWTNVIQPIDSGIFLQRHNRSLPCLL